MPKQPLGVFPTDIWLKLAENLNTPQDFTKLRLASKSLYNALEPTKIERWRKAPFLKLKRHTRFQRNKGNSEGALTEDQVAQLKMCARCETVPQVTMSATVTDSFLGGMKKVNLSHRVRFHSVYRDKLRIIRFVRAAKVKPPISTSEPVGRMEIKHTVPGYVCFSPFVRNDGGREKGHVIDLLQDAFGKAKWSYDGPRSEFKTTNPITNLDTPGDNAVYLPYLIATEFLSVLFDEDTDSIVEVAHYSHCVGAFSGSDVVEGDTVAKLK